MFYFEKQPSEETTRAVDFSQTAELQAGEVITSATVEVTLDDTAAPGILVSDSIDGGRVLFRVRDGEDGKTYKITVLATTDVGHVREADVRMRVREI